MNHSHAINKMPQLQHEAGRWEAQDNRTDSNQDNTRVLQRSKVERHKKTWLILGHVSGMSRDSVINLSNIFTGELLSWVLEALNASLPMAPYNTFYVGADFQLQTFAAI
jgi:hypothetical protein